LSDQKYKTVKIARSKFQRVTTAVAGGLAVAISLAVLVSNLINKVDVPGTLFGVAPMAALGAYAIWYSIHVTHTNERIPAWQEAEVMGQRKSKAPELTQADIQALAKAALWIGLIGLLLFAVRQYLSFDLTKTYFALANKVPVERVKIEKKPHDCEFDTAPIGSKNCHYDAKVFIFKDGDGKRSLDVSYERVED
jgi:hypothetical protein